MLSISKQSKQALSILAECARSEDKWLQTGMAAQAIGTSKDRAAQIVHMLSIEGLIETRRGRCGGIRLAHAARDIRVGDVLRVTEPVFQNASLTSPRREPPSVLNTAIAGAAATFMRILDHLTIKDIAAGEKFITRMSGTPRPLAICPYAAMSSSPELPCHAPL